MGRNSYQKCDIEVYRNAGRIIRLDEKSLKICDEIGRLNSKKFELEKEIDEVLKELEQYNVCYREKHQM